MDIGKAFNYPRNDPGWLTKLLILGLVSCVPILNLAGFGFALEAVRRVSRGEESTLPEWDNFGGYFMDGARVLVTMLVYCIPIFLALGAVFGVAIATSSNGEPGPVFGLLMVLAQLFQIFWQFLIWAVTPALMLRLAFDPGWGAGFDFGGMMGTVTRNVGSYVMVLLMTVAFGFVGALGALACFVGLLITLPYSQMAIAHLLGQLARETAEPASYS